jgi:subtilisin family serine protease
LVVASAGNAANDVPEKTTNTIGEPASCKNIIAVGASQSHGERLYMFDKGKDYLADFSSRGPTVDGRMKPDVVAVGYTCLVPRAHFNLSNKEETYETFGTSFSAPVVSGSAALIRQYFEEGWFPCGTKGCGRAISPCGALVKAVLANGAQSLKGVQKVPSGPITEELSDYDNGQGGNSY